MTRSVVDASVVAKLYFEEELSEASAALFRDHLHLMAPDLLWAELANIAWKRSARGHLSPEQASVILTEALRLPIEIVPIHELVHTALKLAMQTGCTAYDSLYLALAVDQACPLITGDRRMVNALARGPLADRVRWIGSRK